MLPEAREEHPDTIVLPEEQRPMLPEEESPSKAPKTREEFAREELAAKFEKLATRARAAGISPLHAMAQTYVKRGMAVLDGILSALEEAPNKTPADTEKKA